VQRRRRDARRAGELHDRLREHEHDRGDIHGILLSEAYLTAWRAEAIRKS
jgi:hypothetical protein